MTSKDLNQNLLSNLPQLKTKFDEETSWQEGIDTGSFIVFEDVLMPYFKEIVTNKKKKEIDQVFEYIESLANTKDEYVENVVYVAILENIASFDDKDRYIQYFKSKTKEIFDKNYR